MPTEDDRLRRPATGGVLRFPDPFEIASWEILRQELSIDADVAVEEIDRLGDDDQIVGVFFAPQGGHKHYGHPRYDVVHRAAEDNDLAFVYHSGPSIEGEIAASILRHSFEKHLLAHALGHSWGHMANVASLITQGSTEKFPDLNLVMLEGGFTWVL